MEGATQSKKVAIFTTFTTSDSAYSLNRVVQDQIKMFTLNGYKVTVIVGEGFEPKENYLLAESIAFIPNVPVYNEIKKDDSFDDDVKSLEVELEKVLKDVDVILTHDIVYQNAAFKHNVAARRVAEKYPNLKWLHWIHSATSPYTLATLRPYFSQEYLDLLSKKFPNSKYVFFNNYSVPRIAQYYDVPTDDVKVVHHPTDICRFFGIGDEVEKVIERHKILEADAICTYPIRLDRGKQVQYVIKTMAALKEFGMNVRVIIIDFHSTAGDKVTYRDELKALGIESGLNEDELIFTSQQLMAWEYEVPQAVVRDFQILSNVFIMPSVSESYSLITQEAGLLKQLMVLNFDFPPFLDIFGSNAIYRKYSSNIDMLSGQDGNTNTQYGPANISPEERKFHEANYHKETAGMIAYKLRNYDDLAMAIKLRKERNLQFVFKHELEPLLFA